MTTPLRSLTSCVFTATLVAGAEAQVQVLVSGTAAAPQTNVRFGPAVEEITGTWYGGEIELRAGPLIARGIGIAGTLQDTDDPSVLERDAGEIGASIGFVFGDFAGVYVGYSRRRFVSGPDPLDWTIPEIGGMIITPLGTPSLRGEVRAAVMPQTDASGFGKSTTSLGGEAALVVRPGALPVFLRIAYRFERHEFGDTAPRRDEEFQRLTIGAGVAIGGR